MMNSGSAFYTDWQFWSAIAAFVALGLTQLPPVRLWFKGRAPEVDVHDRIGLTHWFGNPQVGMYVTIRNGGPYVLKINEIRLKVVRDGEPIIEAPAQQYFEAPSSTQPVLFVPFQLKPDSDWAHTTYFFRPFDRAVDRQIRRDTSAMAADIQQKLKQRAAGDSDPVEAEAALVEPFEALFARLFKWTPGEYTATLEVVTLGSNNPFRRTYRFTIFESDTEDLRRFVDSYKFGGGVAFPNDKNVPLWIPIQANLV